MREGHIEIQEEHQTIVYPVVPGVSAEKVRQLIDALPQIFSLYCHSGRVAKRKPKWQ